MHDLIESIHLLLIIPVTFELVYVQMDLIRTFKNHHHPILVGL